MVSGRDYGHTKTKSLIFCGPNSNLIPKTDLGCGYKGIVFCRNTGRIIEHGQGTNNTQMGADSLAENTPNASEFICPICLPKPTSSGFQ